MAAVKARKPADGEGRDPNDVPFFEDSGKTTGLRFNYVERKEASVRASLVDAMDRMGMVVVKITPFDFEMDDPDPLKQTRYGYIVEFVYQDRKGVFDLIGLPLRGTATETMRRRVRVQALSHAAAYFEALYATRILMPAVEDAVLTMLFIAPDSATTAGAMMRREMSLAALSAPTNGVIYGEVVGDE